ncbi:MAG: DUF5615 family PIN-like protein [Verrucomicrobia bacterium]|nr:DUF5615 family PIN-like protein [Verrucomicrobiota bacterium]
MPVGLYADVHVPGPVILQLRLRDVDIMAATEEGTNRLEDHELLELAKPLQRVMITQDLRFRALAEDWQRQGRPFAGLVFAHQRFVSYGEMIFDLELVAKATDAEFWQNRVEQLPL